MIASPHHRWREMKRLEPHNGITKQILKLELIREEGEAQRNSPAESIIFRTQQKLVDAYARSNDRNRSFEANPNGPNHKNKVFCVRCVLSDISNRNVRFRCDQMPNAHTLYRIIIKLFMAFDCLVFLLFLSRPFHHTK